MNATMLKVLFLCSVLFLCARLNAQVENVPLEDEVYGFLKKLSVKKIIGSIDDDNPNLSTFEVSQLLKTALKKSKQLSEVERKLISKFRVKYDYEYMNSENSYQLIGSENGFKRSTYDFLRNKEGYLFTYRTDNVSFFSRLSAQGLVTGELSGQNKYSSRVYNVSLNLKGTLFNNLGYKFGFESGGIAGNTSLAYKTFRRVFLGTEKQDISGGKYKNKFTFINGYLKYEILPSENMKLSVQLGREKIKYGLGYSQGLIFSGNHADMDFIKFNFKYGLFNFSSLTASTNENFIKDNEPFTKYIAMNRAKFSLNDLFDIGIGEVIVYSRPFELAYLNPLMFYKFAEFSLQDRDNGFMFFDLQTHFIKDLQFQATYLMDENIIFDNPFDFSRSTNKVALQVGMFSYEPFGIPDLSFFTEYTLIRPYVYSHRSNKSTFTARGHIIGNEIGPNADQILFNSEYYLFDNFIIKAQYSRTRKGKNIVDENGNMIKNVGGDVYVPLNEALDPKVAPFLDGIRANRDELSLSVKYEPLLNIRLELNCIFTKYSEPELNINTSDSFAYMKIGVGI